MRAATLAIVVACVALAGRAQHQYEQVLLQPPVGATRPKRIAIVGLGAGGITALHSLMLLPEDMRQGWQVTVFEEREAPGGIWLPQDDPPPPPGIPRTPLYLNIRTNGPHPSLTVPNTPLAPNTPLLASRDAVLKYWEAILNSTTLTPQTTIWLKHSVTSAKWIGSSSSGQWNLNVTNLMHNKTDSFAFDHLIAAPGINGIPRVPYIEGQDGWVKSGKLLMHSMWYRDPHIFGNKTVLIVGGGPSGLDIARHSVRSANKVYWARNSPRPGRPNWPPVPGVQVVDRFESLSNGVATLTGGSTLPEVDAVVLCTGYQVKVPFLTKGGFLDEVDEVDGAQTQNQLTTNSRYIYPLYEHTLSLDSRYPVGALYISSLLTYNPTGSTSLAQGLFAAYTIADPTLLGTREELLAALKKREELVRQSGGDPAKLGHQVGVGYGALFGHRDAGPFQDLLVHSLRDRGLAGYPGIPEYGFNFTETWRVYAVVHTLSILEGWHTRLAAEGDAWEAEYTSGLRTEADYLDSMRRFVTWWSQNKQKYSTSGVAPSEERHLPSQIVTFALAPTCLSID
ncbi:FAD/NAD(P)-binding domain-containing protein [Auriculariales sp. MPI-PUGE-AT-0066]|nr:FAD/NAD(P)-binding domain-containing protein [Auriculariales sp. MPI-PUGE-AT-0066]